MIYKQLFLVLVLLKSFELSASAQDTHSVSYETLIEGVYHTSAYRACSVKLEKREDHLIALTPQTSGPYPTFPCQEGHTYIFECNHGANCNQTFLYNTSMTITATNNFTISHYDNLGDYIGIYDYTLAD